MATDKNEKTRDQLLKELETATKQQQAEKAAKKRDAKVHSDALKDIEEIIDDVIAQLEKLENPL